MTLLDVQHVKKSIKHVSKEIVVEALKDILVWLIKHYVAPWVSPGQENNLLNI